MIRGLNSPSSIAQRCPVLATFLIMIYATIHDAASQHRAIFVNFSWVIRITAMICNWQIQHRVIKCVHKCSMRTNIDNSVQVCYYQCTDQEVMALPIVVDGKTYLTAAEAARRLGIARGTFNRNVASRLRQYEFGAFRRVYYSQSEVDSFKMPREIEDSHSEDNE